MMGVVPCWGLLGLLDVEIAHDQEAFVAAVAREQRYDELVQVGKAFLIYLDEDQVQHLLEES
jgi:hypothetical protein